MYSNLRPYHRWEQPSTAVSTTGRVRQDLGWGFTRKNNRVFVIQNGRRFGYSAELILIPEAGLGAVILANMGRGIFP